jgi:hypothetical protein
MIAWLQVKALPTCDVLMNNVASDERLQVQVDQQPMRSRISITPFPATPQFNTERL